MGFLIGRLSPALHIGTPLLQGLPFFVHFRVDHRRLRKTVIDIQTQRQQEILNHILLRRPAMDVGLSNLERIDLLAHHNELQPADPITPNHDGIYGPYGMSTCNNALLALDSHTALIAYDRTPLSAPAYCSRRSCSSRMRSQ